MRNISKRIRAFTLVELIVVVALLTLLSALSLSALAGAKPKAQRITCLNNLKQAGLAFQAWAAANGGLTPMQVPQSQGGDAEDVGFRLVSTSQSTSKGASKIFLCMSNELSTPKVLFCPAEYETTYRQAATTFAGGQIGTNYNVLYTNDLNVSYFIGVDAVKSSPRMLLAGDHNLGGNTNPPKIPYCGAPSVYSPSFAVWLGTNWTDNMGVAFMTNQHNQKGNVALADGSVEGFNRSELQTALQNTGDTGRAPGSFLPATGATMGAGCNRIQLP